MATASCTGRAAAGASAIVLYAANVAIVAIVAVEVIAVSALAAAAARPVVAAEGDRAASAAAAAAVRRYADLARSVRAEVLAPDRHPFDPAAVVLREGADPDRLARFVRERIAYEPYAGSVRGPAGTLAAGAGSDWDRARLLRALLAQAGHAARLRVLERTGEEREAVVRAFLEGPDRARYLLLPALAPEVAGPPPSPSPTGILQEHGIPERNRAVLAARSSTRNRRLLVAAYDSAAEEAQWIEECLRGAGETVGRPAERWRDALLEGARERVAVEIPGGGGGAGKAALLEAGPEERPLDAARWRKGRAFDDAPPDRVARLSLRVRLAAGAKGAEKTPLLEQTFVLGRLIGTCVNLQVVPVDEGLASGVAPSGWDAEKWRASVAAFRVFQVILSAGDAWAGSKVFDLDGTVREVGADGRVEGARGAGEAGRRGLGSLFGGGEERGAKGPGIEELTLDLELALPGSPPVRASRLLWGRLRPGVSPVLSANILVLPGPPGAETLAWIAAEALCDNAPLIQEVVLGDDPAALREVRGFARLPGLLHEWQLGRLGLAGMVLASRRDLAYMAGPSIAMDIAHLVPGTESRPVTVRRAIDVALDLGTFLPRRAEAAASAASANLALGVAATALESLLLAEAEPAAVASGPLIESQTARLVGLQAAVRGAAPAGSGGPDAPTGPGAPTGAAKPSPLGRWSIARNEAGRTLVFPREEGPTSWWSIDPATGASLGRGETGEGQSAIEYLKITKMNLDNLSCWLSFQKAILFGGGSRLGAGLKWMGCITGADNPFNYPGAYFGYKGLDDDFFSNLGNLNDAVGGLFAIVAMLEEGS